MTDKIKISIEDWEEKAKGIALKRNKSKKKLILFTIGQGT